ncbi:Protein CMSS1 [Neolecta irregularis DAH-3]|uniref:Protein CMSS1 n=1 Tax=Neolecta irregularis (strain DAH-3) TaxID=1198029 RepID=A0A1U7LL38_NEOID|nr:Protein CMSS1 [Neolecta irregularis DAH-3]|eukprot:OLL23364.1 Protein CMSS1 [Neolecta irregularis DAH-3]
MSDVEGNVAYEQTENVPDKAAKRKRRREELKQKVLKVYPFSLQKRQKREQDEARNIAIMVPALQADYICGKIGVYYNEISTLERQDRYIPETVFTDTSLFGERSLTTISTFLTISKVEKGCEEMGRPHTIVVSAAAIRVAELTREMRKMNAHVLKLFARHIKVEQQIRMLKSQPVAIAVGTPGRLMALVEQDALLLDGIENVVVDTSHLDAKRRSIFDIPECGKDLLDLLYKMKPYKMKIILF